MQTKCPGKIHKMCAIVNKIKKIFNYVMTILYILVLKIEIM